MTCGNGVFAFAGAGGRGRSRPARRPSRRPSPPTSARPPSSPRAAPSPWPPRSRSPRGRRPGGQDDIAWYAASRRADGSWVAEVPVSAHRSAGAYAVHAYATVAGVQAFAGEASFEVSAPRAEVSVTQTAEQRGRRALHGGGEGGPRLVPLRRRVGAAARVVGRGRPGRRRVAWGRAGRRRRLARRGPRPSRTAAPSAPTRRTPT